MDLGALRYSMVAYNSAYETFNDHNTEGCHFARRRQYHYRGAERISNAKALFQVCIRFFYLTVKSSLLP